MEIPGTQVGAARKRQVELAVSVGVHEVGSFQEGERSSDVSPTQVTVGSTETELSAQELDSKDQVLVIITRKRGGHGDVAEDVGLARGESSKGRQRNDLGRRREWVQVVGDVQGTVGKAREEPPSMRRFDDRRVSELLGKGCLRDSEVLFLGSIEQENVIRDIFVYLDHTAKPQKRTRYRR